MTLLFGAVPHGSGAQSPRSYVQQLSPRAEVSMLTILAGDDVWTEFGHSAIRVRDPTRGIDLLYNYGTFDFSDPYFIPKFTYGRLDYMLTVAHTSNMLDFYRRMERPVIEQHLTLTAPQRQALFRFLQINARPENRTYSYDFLFDNCSTRVRDAFEKALGEAVQFSGRPDPGKSFRHLLDPYVANRPALDVGFDLGLGLPADRIATSREVMFLPEYLFDAFEGAVLQDSLGRRPLVAEADTVFWVEGYDFHESAFPWPLVLTWMLGLGGLAWTAYGASQQHDPGRLLDGLLFGMAGLIGLIVFYLWVISEHHVTDANWNIVWAWPTHLVAAVLLAWRSGAGWLSRYFGATAVATALLAAGWGWWPQDLHAAVLPVALLLAVRAAWRGYAGRKVPAEAVGGL